MRALHIDHDGRSQISRNICMSLGRPLAELEYPPFELAADTNVDLHRWFDGKVPALHVSCRACGGVYACACMHARTEVFCGLRCLGRTGVGTLLGQFPQLYPPCQPTSALSRGVSAPR